MSTPAADGLDGGVERVVVRPHRVHVHAVGEDGALEAELAAQDVAEDDRRERRRPVGIERREEDVGGHDERRAGGHASGRRAAGRPRRARRGRASTVGQATMAVDRRVAVARVVLERGDGARRERARDRRRGHVGDEARPLPERAHADGGDCAGWRCSRHRGRGRHARPPRELAADDLVHRRRVGRFAGRAERHVAGPGAAARVHDRPGALLVGAQAGRRWPRRVRAAKRWMRWVIAAAARASGRLSFERYEAADEVALEERLGRVEARRLEGEQKQLPDLLVERHRGPAASSHVHRGSCPLQCRAASDQPLTAPSVRPRTR